jgi:uncharacterized membrane protein (DUF373 family)
MRKNEKYEKLAQELGTFAAKTFFRVEILAYLVLGFLLAVAAVLGTGSAGIALWNAAQEHGATEVLVIAIDRLLFVLMVVEILHTVRDSFRSGTLLCEPFLIVGLIASIRRVLVITLESSQAHLPGKWTADSGVMFNATMLELVVLGGLILVMVVSIFLLRLSDRKAVDKRDATHA